MAEHATIQSLDPRITRLAIPVDPAQQKYEPTPDMGHLETYEVFHQSRTGGRHVHVGSVHASTPELAMIFAKEQFGRRSITANMWVVRTDSILALQPDDAALFETAPEKDFREASGYKVMKKLNAFKKRVAALNTGTTQEEDEE